MTDERFNTVSHLFAACFALVGAALLITQAGAQGGPVEDRRVRVYGLSVVTLFVASTLHHGLDHGPRVNEVLRTLDYDSVFLLIAGSVTPLVLVLFRTTYGWTVLGAVWVIATLGIVLRSMLRELPKYVTNTLYIALGWVPVLLVGAGGSLPVGALRADGGRRPGLQRRLRDLRDREAEPVARGVRLPRDLAPDGGRRRAAALPAHVPLRAAGIGPGTGSG